MSRLKTVERKGEDTIAMDEKPPTYRKGKDAHTTLKPKKSLEGLKQPIFLHQGV